METRSYNVYKFDELPEDAQEKAIENLWDINVDHGWWGSIYEDAKTIGLKITGFDIDRGQYCHGEWLVPPLECIRLIKENHGNTCETFKTAVEFEEQLTRYQLDGNGDIIEDEQIEDDFRNSLLEDYRIILSKDYDYLTSREVVIETIRSNEYLFTVNGELD